MKKQQNCKQKKTKKVKKVMKEFESGKLKTSYNKKVINPKQAIAIALNESKKIKC